MRVGANYPIRVKKARMTCDPWVGYRASERILASHRSRAVVSVVFG